MNVEIRGGYLTDFFASAKETAREIDEGKRTTRKNIIWVEPSDLMNLLKPEKTRLVRHLRGKERVVFSDLVAEMQRTAVSLNRDLNLLSKYRLVRVFKEKNPGHGVHKIIQPVFGDQKLEFKAEI